MPQGNTEKLADHLRSPACHVLWVWSIVTILFIALIPIEVVADKPPSDGPFDWQTATPESQGMSPQQLDALKDSLASKRTRAMLVIRNDRIVYEWYAA